jgi:hypothetical protein
VATIIQAVSAGLIDDVSAEAGVVSRKFAARTVSAALLAARYDGAPMESPGVFSFLGSARAAGIAAAAP